MDRLELGAVPGTNLGDFYGINGFILSGGKEFHGGFPDRGANVSAPFKLYFSFRHRAGRAGIFLQRPEYLYSRREDAEVLRFQRSFPKR